MKSIYPSTISKNYFKKFNQFLPFLYQFSTISTMRTSIKKIKKKTISKKKKSNQIQNFPNPTKLEARIYQYPQNIKDKHHNYHIQP